MRDATRGAPWLMALAALLLDGAAGGAAGPPSRGKWPGELYGLTNLWEVQLTIPAEAWQKMQHTRGGFPGGWGAPPAAKPLPEGRMIRGNFGFDFEYVKADLVIGGTTLKDVAVRFKGSGTYAMSQQMLKKPFKVDLDRHVEGQGFLGATKLVLNNNVMDATCAREALAYAVYRAAGVPAPRTAYAFVRLTVPGKFDRELVGLYTLAEAVDKDFLKKHYGSARGLLLKPERVGPLDHLGNDWDEYDARYRPKTKAGEKAKKKLIALTRLVQYADDERFEAEIGKYVDVDNVLRYLAATVLLSSVDSFMGLAHNYYLYLDPKTDRFSLIPWDVDLSFAGLLMGSAADLMDLSIRQPQIGRNALVERLFANPKHFDAYKGHLRALLKTGFTEEALKRDLAAIQAAIGPVRELEKKAVGARRERGNAWAGMFANQPKLETFFKKRIESVRGQLDGKGQGKVVRSFWGAGAPAGGAAAVIARAILKEADTDKDKCLDRKEVAAAVGVLLDKLEGGRKGPLDEAALAAALGPIVPKPAAPPWGPGPPGGLKPKEEKAKEKPGPARPGPQAVDLARAMVERGGQRGKVSRAALRGAADRLFSKHDGDKDGKLNERELTAALQELLPTPPFQMPAVERPAAPKGKPRGE